MSIELIRDIVQIHPFTQFRVRIVKRFGRESVHRRTGPKTLPGLLMQEVIKKKRVVTYIIVLMYYPYIFPQQFHIYQVINSWHYPLQAFSDNH